MSNDNLEQQSTKQLEDRLQEIRRQESKLKNEIEAIRRFQQSINKKQVKNDD